MYSVHVLELRLSSVLCQTLLFIAVAATHTTDTFQGFGSRARTFSSGRRRTVAITPVVTSTLDFIQGLGSMIAGSVLVLSTHCPVVSMASFVFLGVAIVVIVGSVNNQRKEKQFKALNEKKEDRTVKTIRSWWHRDSYYTCEATVRIFPLRMHIRAGFIYFSFRASSLVTSNPSNPEKPSPATHLPHRPQRQVRRVWR